MFKPRRCPRCRGSLIADRDQHGWYEQCLQCGYQRDIQKAEIDEAKRSIRIVGNTR